VVMVEVGLKFEVEVLESVKKVLNSEVDLLGIVPFVFNLPGR
jgi:hypothetical protein